MGDDRSRAVRQSGEYSHINGVIEAAVESALRRVIDESDSNAHRAQVDCRGELKRLAESLHAGFVSVNARIDGISTSMAGVTESLASGTTQFAVMEVEHRHLRTTVDRLDAARGRRTTPLRDPESIPLINPRLWNTLILAIVTAVGAGVGAFVWDRIHLVDHVDHQPPAISKPTAGP